ncbi:aspartyl-phosphate phosphatase Spo0E family protein [Clostridium sp. LQ25]|nr:aspartyl-phosphate phosphatase Spo0E family protein [Clostridium sp. LQ25]UZT06171.1 aspartyl-phosphate phosphatase Spo0E family protein [Clostridium sp. LQ25]
MGLKEEIEEVRDRLNEMMKNKEQEDYEEILKVSIKLDELIDSYIKS